MRIYVIHQPKLEEYSHTRGASPRSTAGATEVLPVIRREGAYVAASRDDDPETLMARALIAAKSALDRQAKQLEA